MKKGIICALAWLFCVCSALLAGYYLYKALSSHIEPISGAMLCACAFLCAFFAALCAARVWPQHRNAFLRASLWTGFILFVLMLGELVFFNPAFRRAPADGVPWSLRAVFTDAGLNLMPLYTIRNMFTKWQAGRISGVAFLYNIFGNLAAFMPFAFFLPLLFRAQRKFRVFALTVALIVLTVELVQLFSMCGMFDIDDFLLNIPGALAFYGFLRIPPIRRVLFRLYPTE